MNIWNVLGIEPTEDKRAIKKAYAQQLKKYHPEEHPKKFVEINEAYRIALLYTSTAHIPDLPDVIAEKVFSTYLNEESVFENDTVPEEITDEIKRIERLLEQFHHNLLVSIGSTFKKIRTTREFVRSSPFKSFKRNPVFIRKLTVLLKRHSLNAVQIFTLRNAYKATHEHHYGELSSSLADLNSLLKHKVLIILRQTPEQRRNDFATVAAVFIVIGLPLILIVACVSRIIVDEPEPTVLPYNIEEIATSIHIFSENPRQHYEQLRGIERITTQAAVRRAIVEQIYYSTEKESVWLFTRRFDFLQPQSNFHMPELIFFRFSDSDNNARYSLALLYYHFADN